MGNKRITFDVLNRRTHLYLGLALLPWFFVYGLSSVVFSHPAWFGPVQWITESEREYRFGPVPPDADLRALGDRIQKESGLEGHFGVYRSPQGRLEMYKATFWKARRIVYDPEKQRLTTLTDRARWYNVLTRLHTRGGFHDTGILQTSWSVIVDLVQLAIVVWIASGLYMWWSLRRLRGWGFLALGSGCALFVVFMLKL